MTDEVNPQNELPRLPAMLTDALGRVELSTWALAVMAWSEGLSDPTIDKVRDWLGCGRTTAYTRLAAARSAGLLAMEDTARPAVQQDQQTSINLSRARTSERTRSRYAGAGICLC